MLKKVGKTVVAVATVGIVTMQSALADTATAITAIQTAVTADIGAVDTYVYAILVLSLSLWIGLKLIKRGANRAT